MQLDKKIQMGDLIKKWQTFSLRKKLIVGIGIFFILSLITFEIANVFNIKADVIGTINNSAILSYIESGTNRQITSANVQTQVLSSPVPGIKNYPARANTVGWWHMDFNTSGTLTDSSANGLNGTLSGGAAFTSDRNSLQLNGITSFVQLPINTNLNTTNSFTIETWINPKNRPSNQKVAGLFSKGGDGELASTNFNYWLMLANNDSWSGLTSSGITFGFENTPGTNYQIKETILLPLNTWTHLVGVYDRTARSLKLYRNGVLKSSASYIYGIPNTQNLPVFIGKARAGGDYFFSGLMDETRFLKTALTDAQVLEDYNQSKM